MLRFSGLHPKPNRNPAKRLWFGEEEQGSGADGDFCKKSSEQAICSLLRRGAVDKKDASHDPRPPSFSARNPAKRIRAESEEIPIIAQFSPQGGNGAVMGISELAEKEGFEPSRPFRGLHDFQSCALDQLGDFSMASGSPAAADRAFSNRRTVVIIAELFPKSSPFSNFLRAEGEGRAPFRRRFSGLPEACRAAARRLPAGRLPGFSQGNRKILRMA